MLPALTAKNSRGRPNVRHGSHVCQSGWLRIADAKACVFQQPAQQRHGEAGMIDVGVAGDEDDVDVVPAARVHFGARHGQRRPMGNGEWGMGNVQRTAAWLAPTSHSGGLAHANEPTSST